MQIITTPWSAFLLFMVFNLGILISLFFANKLKLSKANSLCLYIWHTGLCFAYLALVYVNPNNGPDSLSYWFSYQEVNEFKLGTHAVVWLVKLLKATGMSFAGGFLVFNIFGTIGLLFFYSSLRSIVSQSNSKKLNKIILVIVFLPSISYWSSAIGKDALSFLSISIFLWSCIELNKRYSMLLISIFVMLLVRPHIAGMMTISVASSFIFMPNVRFLHKLFIGVFSLAGIMILIPFSVSYVGLNEVSVLGEYVENQQNLNQGGSFVDISSMPFPMQIFTYLFRPLIFEASSLTQLASAIDNTFLLILVIYSFRYFFKPTFFIFFKKNILLWNYLFIALTMLSITTANLGLAVRQKWMVMPILLYLLLVMINNKRRL